MLFLINSSMASILLFRELEFRWPMVTNFLNFVTYEQQLMEKHRFQLSFHVFLYLIFIGGVMIYWFMHFFVRYTVTTIVGVFQNHFFCGLDFEVTFLWVRVSIWWICGVNVVCICTTAWFSVKFFMILFLRYRISSF